jgi:hypothetical protein
MTMAASRPKRQSGPALPLVVRSRRATDRRSGACTWAKASDGSATPSARRFAWIAGRNSALLLAKGRRLGRLGAQTCSSGDSGTAPRPPATSGHRAVSWAGLTGSLFRHPMRGVLLRPTSVALGVPLRKARPPAGICRIPRLGVRRPCRFRRMSALDFAMQTLLSFALQSQAGCPGLKAIRHLPRT